MATANHINDSSPAENWRDIPGWEGYYQASDMGRVRSVDRTIEDRIGRRRRLRGTILATSCRDTGHPRVGLSTSEKYESVGVHCLIASAFLGPRPDGMEVCHNNGDATDNRSKNLRYGTRSDNILDASIHGTHNNGRKAKCPRGHVLADPNLVAAAIRKGHRNCLACSRALSSIRYAGRHRSDVQAISDSYYEAIMRDAV